MRDDTVAQAPSRTGGNMNGRSRAGTVRAKRRRSVVGQGMARLGIRRKPQSAAEKARKRLVRILLKECDSPARALELDYWSKEPGLLEIIRGIVMMPEDARATIEAFLLLARNTSSVSAGLDQRGVLTLASVQVARSVALAQYAAAEDELDADLVRMGAPRLLN